MRKTLHRFLQRLMAANDGLSSDQEGILGFSASQERILKRRLGGQVKIPEKILLVHIGMEYMPQDALLSDNPRSGWSSNTEDSASALAIKHAHSRSMRCLICHCSST